MLRLARVSFVNFYIRRQASQLHKWDTRASFKLKSYSTNVPLKNKNIPVLPSITDLKNSPLVSPTFFSAAKAVSESDVRIFLAQIGNINKNDRDPNQNTLLHWAVEGENGDSITKLLLEMGLDVNAKNSIGITPLMLASAMNYISCMKVLLDYGADLNALDNKGNSAIQYACLFDAPDAVQFLLKKGIKVKRIEVPADSTRTKFLYSSAVHKILLESGARVDWHLSLLDDFSHILAVPTDEIKVSLEAYLHFVKSDGTSYTLEEILKNPDSRGLTILSCAAEAGKAEIVKVLLDMGAKVSPKQKEDEYFNSPLYLAVVKNHLKCVELLLQAGAKLGIRELIKACSTGEVETVQFILDKGKIDVNDTFQGYSPVMAATYHGNLAVVKYLEKLGAKLDVVYSTPKVGHLDLFGIAVLSGQEDTINYFWKEKKMNDSRLGYAFWILLDKNETSKIEKVVEMGIDISQIGPYNVKPLSIAAKMNNTRAIELLAKAGANINEFSASASDCTPLIAAVNSGAAEAVQCLIKLNVDVNILDLLGRSALGLAPTPEIMQMLYDAGADVNNKGGIAPLNCFDMDKPELVQKILDLGADINANGSMGTPIMVAAGTGNLPLVRFLMARGVSPSGTIGLDESQMKKELQSAFNNLRYEWRLKKTGITEMAISAAGNGSGTLELVEECFKYETEKSGKLELGSLLVHTAQHGVAPFVDKLLQLGAPIDTITLPNDTSALHMATNNNRIEVVKMLLQAGANRDLKTKDGRTALDIAKSKNYSEIVEILEKEIH